MIVTGHNKREGDRRGGSGGGCKITMVMKKMIMWCWWGKKNGGDKETEEGGCGEIIMNHKYLRFGRFISWLKDEGWWK